MKLASHPAIIACALAAMVSCRREEDAPREKTDLPPPAALAPLTAAAPQVALPVAGFADAVAALPVGATRAAPVLVAVLGIGDTPESQCATWREVVGARAFVLCPRGLPHLVRELADPGAARAAGDEEETEAAEPLEDAGRVVQSGFYFPEAGRLEREVAAGLDALRARYGGYVAKGPVLYTGFSRGAFLGPNVISRAGQQFDRAILVEGGQSAWNAETAWAFARHGGKRVLFACGQPSCVGEAERAAVVLAREKVATRIVHGEGEGHGYKRQVKDQIKASFEWVTEGEPRWRQLLATER